MTGCRVGAKNTLVKNYLHLAERGGAVVLPDTTVTTVRPAAAGWSVETVRTGLLPRGRRTLTADSVVLAAGTLGTQTLLHRMKAKGVLPRLSDRLGVLTRTNSETLLAASRRTVTQDFTQGVAITSSFHPDAVTHVEPCRYGKGSNAMVLLQTVLTDGGGRTPRAVKALLLMARDPLALRALLPHRWSERTIIALVMQTLDNSITTYRKHGRLTSRPGHGAPSPTWIPVGNDVVRRLAAHIGGEPGGSVGDLANISMTAHFLGGCTIGDSPQTGVIDAYHRVYGYDGLHVVDGSAVSANLGVNPALTITAQAERAASLWPNRGEPDLRPAPGMPYRRLQPVAPRNQMVPAHAPAALRIPAVAQTA